MSFRVENYLFIMVALKNFLATDFSSQRIPKGDFDEIDLPQVSEAIPHSGATIVAGGGSTRKSSSAAEKAAHILVGDVAWDDYMIKVDIRIDSANLTDVKTRLALAKVYLQIEAFDQAVAEYQQVLQIIAISGGQR